MIQGSTNVYADLGDPQAEEMLVKAQITSQILDDMRAKGMSCKQLAKKAGWNAIDVESVLQGWFRDTDEASLRQLAAAV